MIAGRGVWGGCDSGICHGQPLLGQFDALLYRGCVEQPGGLVTFQFTDVESSTELWNTDPEAMRAALELHDQILREHFLTHEGYVFATGGDGFGVAFSSAASAVACAKAIQSSLAAAHWPSAGHALRVRIGLDVGEAQRRGGDYFGPVVNRCARIAAAGHGGQVVASEAVIAVVGEEAVPLGVHRLRGFGSATSLWQIGPGDFGSLRTTRKDGNLPMPPTAFLGRAGEIADLLAIVGRHRLTTLTGVGGVGKTRLAIELCRRLRDSFPDGVFFFDLASIGDPAAVTDLVMSVLSISPVPNTSSSETVLEWLAHRRAVLLFDNCEHVIDVTADLIEQALARTEVVVIATSREALRLNGEHIWPVRAFEEARELFVERAIASRPDFDAAADEGAIDAICDDLDRIPLAIELAAARCRTMSVSEIRERLLDRFQLLRGAGRGGTERHQTMHTTIRWSYDLLSAGERQLFDRLCVFPADFDRVAAHSVCAPDGSDPWRTSDTLDALVDQSMLGVQAVNDATRYRLLETFRQFGETQIEPDLIRDLRDRHLRFYLDLAADAAAGFAPAATHESADAAFTREWASLRAAMHWAIVVRDGRSCGELIDCVSLYAMLGLIDEVGEWATDALNIEPCAAPVLTMAAWGEVVRGDFARAYELAAAAARADPDDPRALGTALSAQARMTGMTDPAFVEITRTLPGLARQHPDVGYRVVMLAVAANLLALGDALQSAAVAADVEAMLRVGVGSRIEAFVRAFLARRAQLRQDHEDARWQSARVHQLAGALPGRLWAVQIAYQVEADVALTRNDADAPIIAGDALEALVGSGNWQDCWAVLEPVAVWLHESGERGAAATIAGFLAEHEYASRVPRRAAVLASLVDDPDLRARVEQGRAIDTTGLAGQIHALLERASTVNPSD
jgi:predicted ATPase/class 3 adenylate cyclase